MSKCSWNSIAKDADKSILGNCFQHLWRQLQTYRTVWQQSPGQRCKHPSFFRSFRFLEASSRSPHGHSLIGLLNTSVQLEVNLFFQSPQQQPVSVFCKASGVSTVCFTWLSFQLFFCQQHLHTVSAIYGASWIFYGDPHLCFGSTYTLKISTITAVFTNSVYNLHRCFLWNNMP